MKNWWRKPADRSLLMLGATLLAASLGQFLMPVPPAVPTTVVVPISSLALSCAGLPADTPGLSVAIKGAFLSGVNKAQIEVQSPKPKRYTLKETGVRTIFVTRSSSALFSADGAAASRLVADSSIAGTLSGTRGYATYACQPPSSSQWLVGGSSSAGRTSVLHIANVDDTPATVDLEVWTDAGKSGARSLSGIEIPARSAKQLLLSLIEPGHGMYAIHVRATSGQVSSVIIDRGQQALASLGIDAIPPVNGPLASQFVGVIPDGATHAVLGLLSPGVATAARVSLITSDGTYALAGAEDVSLDPDKLWTIDIPDAALTGDTVVLVQADSAVIAGASVQLSIRGGADLASAGIMAPIYRVASAALDSQVSQAVAMLFSSTSTDVTITVRGDKGDPTRTTVTLKPNAVTRVKLVGSSGSAHLVSIEPAVDGQVMGSLLLQRASVGMVASTVEPLNSVRGYVAVPPVLPDVSR